MIVVGGSVALGAMAILGIDIGGSGVKGAPVDIASGSLLAPRFRLATPQARTPAEIAGAVADVVRHFEWDGMIGCTLPMVVKGGVGCIFLAPNSVPATPDSGGVSLIRCQPRISAGR